MPAADLARALEALPKRSDPNALVGTETADDACVYKLDDERAIVETLDFFTPVVDDLFDFGRVAAANALSDVYAMGGKPLFALNIVAFPAKQLGVEALGRMLAGGQAAADDAGIMILGGHSIADHEPKYGLCVTGMVHPDRLLRNVGGHPGDVLILTKPLGSGILTTGIKKDALTEAQITEVVTIMTTLNRAAAEAMETCDVHACTDITGFGLLGHVRGMVRDGDVGAEIQASALPVIDGTRDLIDRGIVPGGTRRNLAHFGQWTDFDEGVAEPERLICADAQTSGGLLVACAADDVDRLTDQLGERGVLAARVGRLTDEDPGRVRVTA